MNKQELQTDMADARNALLTVLRALPEEVILKPYSVGRWSIKDVVAHITAWEDRLLTVAQKVLWGDGRLVEWIRSDAELEAWNERNYRRLRDWSWPEVLRGLALQREETTWNVTFLSEEQLQAAYQVGERVVTVGGLLAGIAEHDREHLPALQMQLESV
ncbi:DinB family protein [Candidatus Amarolinea aalborgensis]|uniref:DinB family protein n=1 Tax=Candidatus Amarolinea aalborgensis TaxID=2249329 RepID=UPI003BF9D03F